MSQPKSVLSKAGGRHSQDLGPRDMQPRLNGSSVRRPLRLIDGVIELEPMASIDTIPQIDTTGMAGNELAIAQAHNALADRINEFFRQVRFTGHARK